jgi:hypothetical protein
MVTSWGPGLFLFCLVLRSTQKQQEQGLGSGLPYSRSSLCLLTKNEDLTLMGPS